MEQPAPRTAYNAWLNANSQLHAATLAFADGVDRKLSERQLLALARGVAELQETERQRLTDLYAAHPRIGAWHVRRHAGYGPALPWLRAGRLG
ncbi:MAG: hypothetical protein NVS2B4_08630 [Ramlibacter sp.]